MNAAKELLHGYLGLCRQMRQYVCKRYRQAGLTDLQCMVLALLDCGGPMPVSLLAEHTGCANSTISGVIDRLERAGAVERIRSDTDRRVIYVAATEKACPPDGAPLFSQITQQLSQAQLSQLLLALQQFSQALEEEMRTQYD